MEKWTEEKLNKFAIYDLRNIGQDMKVKRPTSLRKDELIKEILAIQSGEKAPHVARDNKGRPRKKKPGANEVLEFLISQQTPLANSFSDDEFEVSSGDFNANAKGDFLQVSGHLDILKEGHGFIRENLIPNLKTDAIISSELIKENNLKAGDLICAEVKKIASSTFGIATKIFEINNKIKQESRIDFDALEKIEINKKLSFNSNLNAFNNSLVIGKGEAVIVYGKDYNILNKQLLTLFNNVNEKKVFLNFNAIENKNKNDIINISSFEDVKIKLRTLDIALNRCKRLAEEGSDVVLFIDDMLSVCDLINNINLINISLDSLTLQKIQKFVMNAGNYAGAGSLTIIAGVNAESNRGQITRDSIKMVSDLSIEINEELSFLVEFPCFNLFKIDFSRNSNLLNDEKAVKIKKIIYDNKDNYLVALEKLKEFN